MVIVAVRYRLGCRGAVLPAWLWRDGCEHGEGAPGRFLVLGGCPAAVRRALPAWRASQAVRMRWLRTASRQASHRVSGARPIRRHQPRLMSLLAWSLMVEKVRSDPVRRW